MCNKCIKCAHYENCGAGTRNCQSYVPKAEVDQDRMSRNAFQRELREYRPAWDAYKRSAENDQD